MKSLLPQSLPGQLAVVMAAALLVASAVNFFIVLGERQRAVFIEQTAGPIARFSDLASALIDRPPPVTGRQSLDRPRRGSADSSLDVVGGAPAEPDRLGHRAVNPRC